MVGAGGAGQLVAEKLVALALHQLLQLGLVVPAALLHLLLPLLVQQDAVDQVAGGIHAAIQIDGGEHGLRGVGQNGGAMAASALFLSPAQLQAAAQIQRLRHLVEALLADEGGTAAGQVALRQIGVLCVQVFSGDEAQHGVAQKPQPLVAADAGGAVLVGIGAVVEGGAEQGRIAEGIAQLFFQDFHVVPPEKIRPRGVVFSVL